MKMNLSKKSAENKILKKADFLITEIIRVIYKKMISVLKRDY